MLCIEGEVYEIGEWYIGGKMECHGDVKLLEIVLVCTGKFQLTDRMFKACLPSSTG